MWAGSLRSPPLGSIPCYDSSRFSSSEMDLVSDDVMECLEEKCNGLGPKTDQHKARLVAMQLTSVEVTSSVEDSKVQRLIEFRFQHSFYYVEHS